MIIIMIASRLGQRKNNLLLLLMDGQEKLCRQLRGSGADYLCKVADKLRHSIQTNGETSFLLLVVVHKNGCGIGNFGDFNERSVVVLFAVNAECLALEYNAARHNFTLVQRICRLVE